MAVLLGFVGITSLMAIYWFTTFKIHIYERIIEEYHYNRVQEIPLAIISSDYENEPFVEKVNKAIYGLYSKDSINSFRDSVKKKTIEQVGEAYRWNISIEELYFGPQPKEGFCRAEIKCEIDHPLVCWCVCNDKCGDNSGKKVQQSYMCNDPKILAECLGSLTINITFYNEIFPFPLVFNGFRFTTEMGFGAYA